MQSLSRLNAMRAKKVRKFYIYTTVRFNRGIKMTIYSSRCTEFKENPANRQIIEGLIEEARERIEDTHESIKHEWCDVHIDKSYDRIGNLKLEIRDYEHVLSVLDDESYNMQAKAHQLESQLKSIRSAYLRQAARLVRDNPKAREWYNVFDDVASCLETANKIKLLYCPEETLEADISMLVSELPEDDISCDNYEHTRVLCKQLITTHRDLLAHAAKAAQSNDNAGQIKICFAMAEKVRTTYEDLYTLKMRR